MRIDQLSPLDSTASLNSSPAGLTHAEAGRRLREFGRNAVEEAVRVPLRDLDDASLEKIAPLLFRIRKPPSDHQLRCHARGRILALYNADRYGRYCRLILPSGRLAGGFRTDMVSKLGQIAKSGRRSARRGLFSEDITLIRVAQKYGRYGIA